MTECTVKDLAERGASLASQSISVHSPLFRGCCWISGWSMLLQGSRTQPRSLREDSSDLVSRGILGWSLCKSSSATLQCVGKQSCWLRVRGASSGKSSWTCKNSLSTDTGKGGNQRTTSNLILLQLFLFQIL